LGQDGQPCKSNTRGLLERAHIIAGRHRRIAKESDRRWEEGDDLESLLRLPLGYEQPDEKPERANLARACERVIRKIKRIVIRELVRRGCSRRILDKIYGRELVAVSMLNEYERRVGE
jgi:hypothetical protein